MHPNNETTSLQVEFGQEIWIERIKLFFVTIPFDLSQHYTHGSSIIFVNLVILIVIMYANHSFKILSNFLLLPGCILSPGHIILREKQAYTKCKDITMTLL